MPRSTNFTVNYLLNRIILVTCGSKPFSSDLAHNRRPETRNIATMKRRLSILFILLAATVITALAHTSHVLGNGAVGIDYGYNLRGWTTNVTSNVFSQQIRYQDPTDGGTPRFNGNISAIVWDQAATGNAVARHGEYRYAYDGLDRLTAANYTGIDNCNHSCLYTYDRMGNATRVSRYGITDRIDAGGTTSYSYGLIDDVTLTYNGNRLVCADDAADALVYAGAMDFHDGANEQTEYAYDANGNLTKDLNKGISRITYDWNNLPREVIFASDATTRYTYDASGRKLQAEYTKINSATEMEISIIPSVPLVETDIIDYQGDNIYRNGALERTLTPNGYIVNDTVYYYVKDYQGNVRNVVREDGAVVESNEYYPYGGLFSATPSAQPYKYGAKELDRTHGLDWYDSKARFYDSILLRTNSMDKKAGDYTWLSPYSWCGGNPIKFVDPDGMDVYRYDEAGNFSECIKRPGEDVYIRDLPEITITPTDSKESAKSTEQQPIEPSENTAEYTQSTISTEEKVGMMVNGIGAIIGKMSTTLKNAHDLSLNPTIRILRRTSSTISGLGTVLVTSGDVVKDWNQGYHNRAAIRAAINTGIFFIGMSNPMLGYGLGVVESAWGEDLYNQINF